MYFVIVKQKESIFATDDKNSIFISERIPFWMDKVSGKTFVYNKFKSIWKTGSMWKVSFTFVM